MKTHLLISCLLLIVGFAVAQNNVDASTPEDVEAFRTLHADDVAVLFFHNSQDSKETGFFESIFGIFGNKEDLDEQYQAMIAEKYPIIEIDSKIDALKEVPDNYEVNSMPYVIAYYKDKVIWKEKPSKQTAEIIENLVKEQKKGTPLTFENTSGINGGPALVQRQIDLDREISTPQVKPVATKKAATPKETASTKQAKPVAAKSQAAPAAQAKKAVKKTEQASTTATTQGSKSKVDANGMIEVVDPFDESIHYKVEATPAVAHIPGGVIPVGPTERIMSPRIQGGPGRVVREPVVHSGVSTVTSGSVPHVYSGESNRVIQRPQSVVQNNLQGSRVVVSSDSRQASQGAQRSYTTVSQNGAPVQTASTTTTTTRNGARTSVPVARGGQDSWANRRAYGPAEVQEGVVVRKFDGDRNSS